MWIVLSIDVIFLMVITMQLPFLLLPTILICWRITEGKNPSGPKRRRIEGSLQRLFEMTEVRLLWHFHWILKNSSPWKSCWEPDVEGATGRLAHGIPERPPGLPPPGAGRWASRACSSLHWCASHWCNKLSARGDNREAATLFPHCRDEIQQTDVPINPNSLTPAFNIDSREFILLPKWKKYKDPRFTSPFLSELQFSLFVFFVCFFSFEGNFWTDLLLKAKGNSRRWFKFLFLQLLVPLALAFASR